ncbi:enoyl-CoA hydratase/isomerase family protein [Nocardia australiensis]|uniref:enoyl-CoA hydratase/isomerase family protein n=1 Tax=Nocardia australiensis TaxID=2887191 RepID=UPI001D140CE1|nr:enoyl-CoA hydratase/isomerase family protein [Nocardia australiensis]
MVETERLGGIGIVRLNRPDRGNALTGSMPREICEAIEELGSDESVAGVVLTGAGRLFCAGGDAATLLEWRSLDLEDRVEQFTKSQEVVLAIRACPVPVVAAINGPAAGAGVDLALACDLRIAADTSSFTAAFAAVGLVPDLGGSWSLSRLVGESRALHFLLSGERLSATDALNAGMVDQVVEGGELIKAASTTVEQITGAVPRSVVTETLLALRGAAVQSLATSMQHAARAQARLMTTAEHQERIAAYLPT